jgi:hypothetical protein
MAYIGTKPADKPLTSADITDGIITNADINSSAAISLSKLSTTGTADATTFLRGDGAYTAISTSGIIVSSASDVYTGGGNTYSTSFSEVSSNFRVTVTPASIANKVLIICSFNAYNASDGSGYANFTLYRNSTNLGDSTYGLGTMDVNDGTVPATIHFLDSPSSTSALTYSLYYRTSGTGGAYINNNNGSMYITALEIKG